MKLTTRCQSAASALKVPAVAVFITDTAAIAWYAPVLLVSGIITGFFTGQLTQIVLNHMDKLRPSA